MVSPGRSQTEKQSLDALRRLGLSTPNAKRAISSLLGNPVNEVQRVDRNVKYFPVTRTSENHCLWSAPNQNALWLSQSVQTIEEDTTDVLSPRNQWEASKITAQAFPSNSFLYQSITIPAEESPIMTSDDLMFSVYMRAGTGATVMNGFRLVRTTPSLLELASLEVNLDTGAVIDYNGRGGIIVKEALNNWWHVGVRVPEADIDPGDNVNFNIIRGGAGGIPEWPNGNPYVYRWAAQVSRGTELPDYQEAQDAAVTSDRYVVPLSQLIAGVNIVGIRVPGPVTVYLPLRASEEQVIVISDERGTADTDPITVRVA